MSHFYILYKIINNINNKFYIGVHKTDNIHDDYYGSGHSIKAAIEKYDKENFTKEILHVFTNAKKAFKKEKEIVNSILLEDKNCYNIKEGGHGGFDHIRKAGLHKSSKGRKIIYNPATNEQTKVKPEEIDNYLSRGWLTGFRPSALKKMSTSGKRKIQTEEQKRKNSESKKNARLMLNVVTGIKKFIKCVDIEYYETNGWRLYTEQFLKRK